MNEEEKWLKTKIENVVESSASNRLARIKEKAVSFDEEYETPVKKKRSILRITVTSVSCVIFALTVAVIAASPFIFNAPPTVPGDTTEKGVYDTESKEDIRYEPTEYAPVESADDTGKQGHGETEISEEEPYNPVLPHNDDPYDPIVGCLIENGIADGGFTIESIYATDHPETDCLFFPTSFDSVDLGSVDLGSCLAIRVRQPDRNLAVLHHIYYFAGFGDYVRGLDFYPDGKPDAVTICEIIKTAPFVFEVINACEDINVTSLADVLKYAGFAKTDIDRIEYHYYIENGEAKLDTLELYPTDMSEGYYTLAATPDSEAVRQLFGEYEVIKQDGSTLLDSFIVPVSSLNAEQLNFVGANIISNTSGTIRIDGGDSFGYHIAKLFGRESDNFEMLEISSDYSMCAMFKSIITEYCTRKVVWSKVSYRISKEDYYVLKDSCSSLGDTYIAMFRAMKNGAVPVPVQPKNPSYDTTTSRLLSEYVYDFVPALRGTVIKAVYDNTDPDSLRIKVRCEYGTVLDAVFSSTSRPEWGSIYFDNTEEVKEGDIDFIRTFISSADSVTTSLEEFDFSDCSDGKEALNKFFHTIYEDTRGFDVCKVKYVENKKINDYSLCFYGKSEDSGIEYYFPVCGDDADVIESIFNSGIDSINAENVIFAAESFVKQTTETYDLHGGYYDPLTDAVNAITGKEYIEVESIDMFEIEYDMFFRIDVLDAEGGVTSYYVCGVGNDLFMACASGDDGAIADALMGCELRTYDECEEILNQIRPTEEDGVFAFDTFSFANDSELYKAGDPGVKTEGFVNTRPSGSDLPVSVLLEKAKAECTVEYDTVRIQFDPRSYVFSIDFYVKDVLGGDESVYIDLAGRTKLIVYGE